MGLFDIIAGAVKFAFGIAAGFVLMTLGLLFCVITFATGNTQVITSGIALIIIGTILGIWGENSRRSTLQR